MAAIATRDKYCVALDANVDREVLRANVARTHLGMSDSDIDVAVDLIISLSRTYPVMWNERHITNTAYALTPHAADIIRAHADRIASTWPADCYIRLAFDRISRVGWGSGRMTVAFEVVRGPLHPPGAMLGTDTDDWKQHAQSIEDVARLYAFVTPLEMAKLCRLAIEQLKDTPHRWYVRPAMGRGGAKHASSVRLAGDSDACAIGSQLRTYFDGARAAKTADGPMHLDLSVARDEKDLVITYRAVLSNPPTHTAPCVQSPDDLHELYSRASPTVLATLAQIDGRLHDTVPHVWVDFDASFFSDASTFVTPIECTNEFVDGAVFSITATLFSRHLSVKVSKRHVVLCFNDTTQSLLATVVATPGHCN